MLANPVVGSVVLEKQAPPSVAGAHTRTMRALPGLSGAGPGLMTSPADGLTAMHSNLLFLEVFMRRIAKVILVSMLLAGCTSLVDSVQQSAQEKLQQFLANQFGQRLQSGIDAVISQLAAKGGYLDDPLVRILLPPPLGLVIGVARDLQQNPQATLLETLINQAAENSIPVAGPILKNIVMNMETPSLESLLKSGNTAATDTLKEKGGAAVKEALLPAITEQLHANGAIALYGELLKAKEISNQIAETATGVQQKAEDIQGQAQGVQPVSQDQLGQYVADQAMGGLFKKVAKQEISVRRSLESSY